MEIKEIERDIARFESVNDQLKSELDYVDKLLTLSGFSKGIESFREAAFELIEDPESEEHLGGFDHE